MEKSSEERIWMKDITTIGYNVFSVASIVGLFGWNVVGDTTDQEKIICIIAGVIIIVWMILYYRLYRRTKKSLAEKDAALIHKDEEREAVLKRKDNELEAQRKEIQRWSEKVKVLTKALQSEFPPQVGFYAANKETYDDFKNGLHLLKCDLDVRIIKDDKLENKYNFQFYWTLLVENTDSLPAKEVNFIYSGEKNDNTFPEVSVEQDGQRSSVAPQMRPPESSTGEDRFITIDLPKPLEHRSTATVYIHYTPPTYPPNRDRETIWLVPDALGFAGVSEFRIRVFCDGEIIRESTECILRSYKISETCSVAMEDNQSLSHHNLNNNNETGFSCHRSKNLSGYAYLLILINNRDNLPPYLKDTPTRNRNGLDQK